MTKTKRKLTERGVIWLTGPERAQALADLVRLEALEAIRTGERPTRGQLVARLLREEVERGEQNARRRYVEAAKECGE